MKRRNESKEEKSALETTQEKRHVVEIKREKKISCLVTDSNCDRNRFLFKFKKKKTQVQENG